MQIASSGLRWATARAANAMGHKPPMISTRSIHIPHAPPAPLRAPPTTVQRVAQTARTAAVRFFQHLTTPGIGAQGCAHVSARTFQAAARPTIQQGFSLPVRNALLNKPFAGPCLPRAPAVPRGVHQVGLGTARAFHSGRPIFANLVENVPLVARALTEADVGLEKRKVLNRPSLLKKKASAKTQEKGKGPRAKENVPAVTKTAVVEDSIAEDLDVYLPVAPVAPVAPVTTRLLIPLAPTPSGRTPLPADIPASSSFAGRFLPLSTLASMHASHHTHSLRVSTVFARLDSAGVWKDPCVRSRSYGSPDGTCVLLEVTFDGWDEERVRAVLGDAGRGWCEVEETRTGIEDSVLDQAQAAPRSEVAPTSTTSEEIDRWFSGLDHHLSSPPPARVEIESDPTESVILPTLDFSSFPTGVERHSASDYEWDAFSDGALSDLGSDDVALYGLSSPMRDLSHGWDMTSQVASPPTREGPIKYLF